MVFHEESKTSWFWPLVKSPFHSREQKDEKDSKFFNDVDDDKWERERAFDIADSIEKGLAREIVTEFMHPLRRSQKLWRFHVNRSEDKLQYRLFSDDGDFLMYARATAEAKKVEFFTYNPSDRGDKLFDASKPAFTMTYTKEKMEFRIVQERCERCQFSPKHLTCDCHGKQQVAVIRHSRQPVGEGIFNGMDILVPGLSADGTRVVWCPLTGRGDLGVPYDTDEAHVMVTKQPVWNDEVGSLVLDFKGRQILSSAKNFQLTLAEKPDHVVCQYGKISTNTFSLDFRYPLSVVQAFGASLTTMSWT